MGGKVQRIVVTELRRPEDIFYAVIEVEIDGKIVEVDARPSDAIALAVRVDVPILVHESVMEAAAVEPEEDVENQIMDEVPPSDDRLQVFKDFVDTLDFDEEE